MWQAAFSLGNVARPTYWLRLRRDALSDHAGSNNDRLRAQIRIAFGLSCDGSGRNIPTPMNSFHPTEFIAWTTWYANELGTRLTPIRLVKFLYLLDLYYAR